MKAITVGYFHPDSELARRAVQCLVDLQARAGGNALIGRTLYPLLTEAGFAAVRVSPRMVYVDSSKPQLVDGFTRRTFTAMVEGVRQPAIAGGLATQADFDRGIADLYRTGSGWVFCYTFFKAFGITPNQDAEMLERNSSTPASSPSTSSARWLMAGSIAREVEACTGRERGEFALAWRAG